MCTCMCACICAYVHVHVHAHVHVHVHVHVACACCMCMWYQSTMLLWHGWHHREHTAEVILSRGCQQWSYLDYIIGTLLQCPALASFSRPSFLLPTYTCQTPHRNIPQLRLCSSPLVQEFSSLLLAGVELLHRALRVDALRLRGCHRCCGGRTTLRNRRWRRGGVTVRHSLGGIKVQLQCSCGSELFVSCSVELTWCHVE